jgi:hypothetical protein
MAPGSRMGASNSPDAMSQQSTHRSAMSGHSGRMRHSREDTSQNAAVDRLNDESYQAAQRGEAFGASNMGQRDMTAPSGSGSMRGTGSMSGTGSMNGMSSGPMSGTSDTTDTSGTSGR